MNTATLHVKVSPRLAAGLKNLARRREIPVGELVRQAIAVSYQMELLELPINQRRAVEAYGAGYISIGKLAEELGMNVFAVRKWLSEREIPQMTEFMPGDVRNA